MGAAAVRTTGGNKSVSLLFRYARGLEFGLCICQVVGRAGQVEESTPLVGYGLAQLLSQRRDVALSPRYGYH